MNIKEIPKDEIPNVLTCYWQLLREVESLAQSSGSPLNRHLVEGSYTVLNRIGATPLRPVWED